jgi:hypothetical protein
MFTLRTRNNMNSPEDWFRDCVCDVERLLEGAHKVLELVAEVEAVKAAETVKAGAAYTGKDGQMRSEGF